MADVKYCELCKRNVEPKKDFNWLIFIFLCGLFYIPIYLAQEAKCPICGSAQFSEARPEA